MSKKTPEAGLVASMTGHGQAEENDEHYSVKVELKSWNNRFKDMRFKIPGLFSSEESGLRRNLENHFKRGSFEILISYKHSTEKSKFDNLDKQKIEAFLKEFIEIGNKFSLPMQITPGDFMRSEFAVEQENQKLDFLKPLLLKAFEKAIAELRLSRVEEGQKMAAAIEDSLTKYQDEFVAIKEQTKLFETTLRDKLLKRFEDFKQKFEEGVAVDENRFHQELVYYLEKMDIQEEIHRIESHLVKVRELITTPKGGEVGRQLEFFLQELGRETNTIGSKSNTTTVSGPIVQMKVYLEKIREMALNLE